LPLALAKGFLEVAFIGFSQNGITVLAKANCINPKFR
jgi:hypothetical protein